MKVLLKNHNNGSNVRPQNRQSKKNLHLTVLRKKQVKKLDFNRILLRLNKFISIIVLPLK